MKLNPILILLPTVLLASVPLGFVLLLALMGFSDETNPSESVLESNFDLPCSELSITESTWNFDLNVLVVDLESPPSAAFFEALQQRGWTREPGKLSFRMDGMTLSYHDRQLVMLPTSYMDGDK